jgi:MFS family permease
MSDDRLRLIFLANGVDKQHWEENKHHLGETCRSKKGYCDVRSVGNPEENRENSPDSQSAKLFRTNIKVIASSGAVNSFGSVIVSTYVSYYFVSIGGDAFKFGILASISTIIQCLVFFLGGRLADHYGRRRIIVIAAFYAVLFPILYALILDWRIFFAVSALSAFGAVSSPASHATVADSVSAEKRTTEISTIQVVQSCPVILSPLIGASLIETYKQNGFRMACVLVAATTLVSALILLFLKETIRKRNGQKARGPNNSTVRIRELSARTGHSLVSMLFAYGLVAFANALIGSYYILYATQVVGLDIWHYGIIVSLQFLLIILLKIPGGWVADKFGKKKIMIISILTCTPFVVAFTFSRSFPEAAITMILLAIAGMYYAPAHEALQADLTPSEMRGRITSFWDVSNSVGVALGAPLGGFLFLTVSPAIPFYLFAVIEVAAALLILVAVKEPQRAEN